MLQFSAPARLPFGCHKRGKMHLGKIETRQEQDMDLPPKTPTVKGEEKTQSKGGQKSGSPKMPTYAQWASKQTNLTGDHIQDFKTYLAAYQPLIEKAAKS